MSVLKDEIQKPLLTTTQQVSLYCHIAVLLTLTLPNPKTHAYVGVLLYRDTPDNAVKMLP